MVLEEWLWDQVSGRFWTGSAICMQYTAAARCRLVCNQPFFEDGVHPGLPSGAIGPECRENFRVEPDGDLLFGRILVLPAGLSKRADGCCDATTTGDNATLPVDFAGCI